jgi:hypothetical protein
MNGPDDWDDEERDALAPFRSDLDALRQRHHGRPPLELLRAARADALPEPLRHTADAHLDGSAWSRALVDGIDAADVPPLDIDGQQRVLERIHQALREERAARVMRRWRWATAVAAAVLLAVFVVRRSRPGEPAVDVPPASPPQVAAVPSPAPPAFHIPLDKPEVRFTAAALVLRGEGSGPRFVDVIAPAIAAYRAGDYATAARDLAPLASRYPQSVEVPFYLGVSRLFLDDADGARTSLEAARRVSEEGFDADVEWYLAIANDRAGRRSEARAGLDRLCRGLSPRARPACDAAEQLGSR